MTLNNANKLAAQLLHCYIDANNLSEFEKKQQSMGSKDYKARKNNFFYEIEPIRYTAIHLKECGEEPESIEFCAQNQLLGYDGIFKYPDREVPLEVTRATGKDGGQDEQLVRELLKERGTAPSPYVQRIDFQGTKNNRTFGPNIPEARMIHDSEFSFRLQQAFNNKNIEKYNDCWLIISVPDPWGQELIFYKSCLAFWDNIGQNAGFFKRIFVVSEEAIKQGFDKSPVCVWDSKNNDRYLHYKNL